MTKTTVEAVRRKMRGETMAEVGLCLGDHPACTFDKIRPNRKVGLHACSLTTACGSWVVSYWTEKSGVADVWPIDYHIKAVRMWGWLRKHTPDPESDEWESLIEDGVELSVTSDSIPKYPAEIERQIAAWRRLYPFSAITELSRSLPMDAIPRGARSGLFLNYLDLMMGNTYAWVALARLSSLVPVLSVDWPLGYNELSVPQRAALAAIPYTTRTDMHKALTDHFVYQSEYNPSELADRVIDRIEEWSAKARADTAAKEEWHRETFERIRYVRSTPRWKKHMDDHIKIMRSIGIELE